MGKNKILSSILIGLSFYFVSSSVQNVYAKDNLQSILSYVDIDKFKEIDISGSKYDLALVNPSVVQAVIRVFDDVNSGALSVSEENSRLEEVSKLLDEYSMNPKSFENFPVTLDLSPSTLLREEIEYVQSKILELKDKKESLGDDGGNIQKEIGGLSSWVNYSVVNFESSKYKRTFSDLSKEEFTDSKIFSSVYSTLDFEKVFRIFINSDGSFEIQNKDISNMELFDIIKSNIEFENYKVRYLINKLDNLRNLLKSNSNVEGEILNLKREIESVKAYGISQEIVLLNMQKDFVKHSKVSEEFMEEKIRHIDDEISKRVDVLKEFSLNFESGVDFSPNVSTFGDRYSYFGYYIDMGNGLGFIINLDKDGKLLLNEGYELADVDNNQVKSIILSEISDMENRISDIETKRNKIKASGSDGEYYLLDAIDKRISVLKNDIDNYKIILSKI